MTETWGREPRMPPADKVSLKKSVHRAVRNHVQRDARLLTENRLIAATLETSTCRPRFRASTEAISPQKLKTWSG